MSLQSLVHPHARDELTDSPCVSQVNVNLIICIKKPLFRSRLVSESPKNRDLHNKLTSIPVDSSLVW